jgi:hypothetical protein
MVYTTYLWLYILLYTLSSPNRDLHRPKLSMVQFHSLYSIIHLLNPYHHIYIYHISYDHRSYILMLVRYRWLQLQAHDLKWSETGSFARNLDRQGRVNRVNRRF